MSLLLHSSVEAVSIQISVWRRLRGKERAFRQKCVFLSTLWCRRQLVPPFRTVLLVPPTMIRRLVMEIVAMIMNALARPLEPQDVARVLFRMPALLARENMNRVRTSALLLSYLSPQRPSGC